MSNLIGDFISENFNKLKRHLQYSFEELSEAEAEDIIQQTILKILGSGRSNSIEYLSSYFYKAISNGATDYFRKNKRIVPLDSVDTGNVRNAEDDILNLELGSQIRCALEQLDEKSRLIFIETEINGRSYMEISQETGEPVGTLLSRKSRAVSRLRKLLVNYVKDGGIS
ncbi:MAG: sigma-70 family RNA polymerase sigma factor [Clostridia bacterium]|nr:sigma-70 family RNA polymerase sigma factor [Clostridia bacterium]